jgi:hypothetical protein
MASINILLPLNFDTSGLISPLVAIQYLPHGVPLWMSIAERAPRLPGVPNRNDNRVAGARNWDASAFLC